MEHRRWHDSGETLDLPGCDYTITFKDIPDWFKPADIPVTVSGDLIEKTGEYTEDPMGQLQVTITPQEAIKELDKLEKDAHWSIDDGATWHKSGKILNLPVDNYTVTFKDLDCWKHTGDTPVTLIVNQLKTVKGKYKKQGALKVIIMPQAAIDASVKWRLHTGSAVGEWKNSGDTVLVAFGSTQTVEFSNVPGWMKPDDMTVVVDSCEPPIEVLIDVLPDVKKKLERNGSILIYDDKPIRLVGYGAYGLVAEKEFKFKPFLDRLDSKGINFVRIWVNYHWTNSLTPFVENGSGKYDLTKPNSIFYNRLKGFVEYAADRDIIVMVTLFDAVALDKKKDNRWKYCPYNQANNNNGYISHPDEFFDTTSSIWNIHERLISEVVNRLGDFGNVIYEVMNEPTSHGYEKDGKYSFHEKVVKHLKSKLAGHSGSKIIAVNVEEDVKLKTWAIHNVDVIAYHVKDPRDSGDYNSDPLPVIISNDGDMTQTFGKDNNSCEDFPRRLKRTKCFLLKTFENGASYGHYHFEFLDKEIYGNSWLSLNYEPNMNNVESYLDKLLNLLNGPSYSFTYSEVCTDQRVSGEPGSCP
ncbi:cellulase family glycosylhydrolase [Desulfococcaceae bacterium HSG9]|nr:cellulase family glycosylhydrolase [Desulfococcaceae bacterium HSG9]